MSHTRLSSFWSRFSVAFLAPVLFLIAILASGVYLSGCSQPGAGASGSKWSSSSSDHESDQPVARPRRAKEGYRPNVKITLYPHPTNEPRKVIVNGVIHNRGDKKITLLKIVVRFVDKHDRTLASESDVVAHDLSMGWENAPVLPHRAKRFQMEMTGVPRGWRKAELKYEIQQIDTD